jgi:hypothetical protein
MTTVVSSLQTVFSSTAATTIARLVMKFNQISYLAVVMNWWQSLIIIFPFHWFQQSRSANIFHPRFSLSLISLPIRWKARVSKYWFVMGFSRISLVFQHYSPKKMVRRKLKIYSLFLVKNLQVSLPSLSFFFFSWSRCRCVWTEPISLTHAHIQLIIVS